MWKGRIALGRQRLDVKMYSAIEDRSVRFRMLHKKDHAPVEQHIIRKDTGADVQREDIRKAFSISEDTAVILQPEELEALLPPDSRDIQILRFVTPQGIDDQWYERPYYLGPEDDAESYFALAQALEDTKLIGISRWVMRKKRYVGALTSINGYLTLTTMRRADQILKVAGMEPAVPLANELKLAEQLVSSISADFDPHLWQNEYRQRLLEVIDAKARGNKVTPIRVKQKSPSTSLAASLRASIAEVREKKRA
jgi:DNA end-binding protein Ku